MTPLLGYCDVVYDKAYNENLISAKTKSTYNTKNTEKATLFFSHPMLLNGTC